MDERKEEADFHRKALDEVLTHIQNISTSSQPLYLISLSILHPSLPLLFLPSNCSRSVLILVCPTFFSMKSLDSPIFVLPFFFILTDVPGKRKVYSFIVWLLLLSREQDLHYSVLPWCVLHDAKWRKFVLLLVEIGH